MLERQTALIETNVANDRLRSRLGFRGRIIRAIPFFLLGLSGHQWLYATPPAACPDQLQVITDPVSASGYRAQIIETLVTRYPLLFNMETVTEFETYFKRHLLGNSARAELDFTFARSASALATLTASQRTDMAEYIWTRLLETNGFNKPAEESPHIPLAERLRIPHAEAQNLWQRVHHFENTPALRHEIVDLIATHLPRFIQRGSLYVGVFTGPVIIVNKGETLGPIDSTHAEARWRIPASLAAIVGVGLAAKMFGVPWEPHWQGSTYWELNSYEVADAHMYWLQTAGAATMYLPLVSMGVLGNVRRTVRAIWHRRFVRQLKRAPSPSPVDLPFEFGAAPLAPLSLSRDDAWTAKSLRDLTRDLDELHLPALDPGDPEYLASDFTRFADVELGEANLLISVKLARVNAMMDEAGLPQEWSKKIRDYLARGEINALNQAEYSLRMHQAFVERKRVLLAARQELTALDHAVNEIESAVARFVDFARHEPQRPHLNPVAVRNLRLHVLALQDQRDVITFMKATLAQLQSRLEAQYAQLTRAGASLTVLNLRPAVSKTDLNSTWTALAGKLEML